MGFDREAAAATIRKAGEKWPTSFVPRSQVPTFTGGLIAVGTLANMDSEGRGPKGAFPYRAAAMLPGGRSLRLAHRQDGGLIHASKKQSDSSQTGRQPGKSRFKPTAPYAIITAFLQHLKRLALWFVCRDIFPGVIEIVVRKGGLNNG